MILENYRRVLNDCAKALTLNPKCIKAYYRSAKACRALEKVEDALDACNRGLEVSINS
jgi:tetratricopeptide (TPR) repeat protein